VRIAGAKRLHGRGRWRGVDEAMIRPARVDCGVQGTWGLTTLLPPPLGVLPPSDAILDVRCALIAIALGANFLLETLKAKKGELDRPDRLRTEPWGKIMNTLAKAAHQPAEPRSAAKSAVKSSRDLGIEMYCRLRRRWQDKARAIHR